MKTILCFGDSNTYGYNPLNGLRYAENERWPGILRGMLGGGFSVIEEGCNGRTTVFADPAEPWKEGRPYLKPCLHSHRTVDYLVLMLGTNDLKTMFKASPEKIAAGIETLIRDTYEYCDEKQGSRPRILLISPHRIGEGITESAFANSFDASAPGRSEQLSGLYRAIAEKYDCLFLNAADYIKPSEADSLHLMPDAHRTLAQQVYRILMEDMKAEEMSHLPSDRHPLSKTNDQMDPEHRPHDFSAGTGDGNMAKEVSMAPADAAADREKVIVRTSILGILANVVLAAFKAGVGFAANSIAVVLDAVNNLSDALSSVITIVGTKLAGRAPDKKHPLGYGRIEYLTSMIVSGIVLYAGITSLTESVKKIIHPETAEYSPVSLIIIGAAIAVKLVLGAYVKKKGREVNSGSLLASGSDASFDAILSASVLASALIFLTTGVSLEAYVGVVIAVFIIKSGIEMMIDTLNDILGSRTDSRLAREIKRTVCEDPQVLGAFDLFLYNYGPDKNYGSIHVEVNDTLTAREIDALDRRIQARVYARHGVSLTGIGLYAVNTGDDEAARMRRRVIEMVLAHDASKQVHGFYVDLDKRQMSFDVVLTFECDREKALREIKNTVQEVYPDYNLLVQADVDITE